MSKKAKMEAGHVLHPVRVKAGWGLGCAPAILTFGHPPPVDRGLGPLFQLKELPSRPRRQATAPSSPRYPPTPPARTVPTSYQPSFTCPPLKAYTPNPACAFRSKTTTGTVGQHNETGESASRPIFAVMEESARSQQPGRETTVKSDRCSKGKTEASGWEEKNARSGHGPFRKKNHTNLKQPKLHSGWVTSRQGVFFMKVPCIDS